MIFQHYPINILTHQHIFIFCCHMKTRLALLLIAGSIILASVLHMAKTHEQATPLDKLSAALETARPAIGPTSNILIENRTNTFSLPFMTRIILAPAYTTINGDWDTTLILSGKDTLIPAIPGRNIIWQHTDSLYQYTITSKQ